jgi:hypothetical protein
MCFYFVVEKSDDWMMIYDVPRSRPMMMGVYIDSNFCFDVSYVLIRLLRASLGKIPQS